MRRADMLKASLIDGLFCTNTAPPGWICSKVVVLFLFLRKTLKPLFVIVVKVGLLFLDKTTARRGWPANIRVFYCTTVNGVLA